VDSYSTFRALGGSDSMSIGPKVPSFPSPSPFSPFEPAPGKGMKVIDMSSVTQSLQSWNISVTASAPKVQQKPVQDCPSYFESNSSCLTSRSPREAFEVLIHHLNKMKRIDIEYKPLNNKIKGVYYCHDSGSPCTFHIKLFKAPLGCKEKYLLEVQRRYGCVVVFRKLYQQILQALTAEGIAVPFTKTAISSSSILAPGQIVLDKPTLEILMKGVKSNTNLEHLREILRLLACLSNSAQNRALLVESHSETNLCDLLARVLQLPDVEVRRCGAAFLGNIATVTNLRSELISKLLGTMFNILSGSTCGSAGFGEGCGELIKRETQRQIVRALLLISETHAKQIIQDPSASSYVKTLTNLQSSNDPGLRADVLLTLEQLKVQ